jgi:hypothetical protein
MKTLTKKIEIITKGEADILQYQRYCKELEKCVIISRRTIVTAIDEKGNAIQFNTVRGYGGWTEGHDVGTELKSKREVMKFLKQWLND